MKCFFVNNKLIFIFCAVITFGLFFSLTYASDANLPVGNMAASIVSIDDEVYEKLEFNSNNFELIPILDKFVSDDNVNVIKLNFLVGGSNNNNIDNIIYDLSLKDLKLDCALLSPYMKWKLLKNGEVISFGNLSYEFDTIVDGKLVLTPIQQDLKDYSEDKSTYDNYTFYMWLSDSCQDDNLTNCKGAHDLSGLLNKKISGKISIDLNVGAKKELVRKPSNTLNTKNCILESEVDY